VQAAAGRGVGSLYCDRHLDHRARNGSLWHPTYRAAQRKPYEAAAAAWIRAYRTNTFVTGALNSLDTLLQSAGSVIPANSLRGLPPERRANIALARLRDEGVKPDRILATYLGVVALIEDDPGSHRVREFRIVQVAKALHRLAAGTHRRWEIPNRDGSTTVMQIDAYARSSGHVLRYLGASIESACELVAETHLQEIIQLKHARSVR
jgi:hypothetical protein